MNIKQTLFVLSISILLFSCGEEPKTDNIVVDITQEKDPEVQERSEKIEKIFL